MPDSSEIVFNIGLRGRGKIQYSELINELKKNRAKIEEAIGLLEEGSEALIREIVSDILAWKCRPADFPVGSVMPELIMKLRNYDFNDHEEICVPACSVLSDLWEIPLFYRNVTDDGKICARRSGEGNIQYVMCDGDIICKETGLEEKYEIRKVVAISGALYSFTNVDLVKAFGMIPYLFHRMYGCEVKLVSYEGNETYPYLDLLTGLKMELIENKPPESMVKYIHDNSKNIDLLIIQGAYEYNHDVVVEYKRQNPGGKIFMNLDQNSEWMDRIIWDDPDYYEMMSLIDVKGSTCKPMQVFLNEKWPWHIECIHQGYYDLFGFNDNIDEILKNKKKIILCVARHGTWQKATEVLMEAFAMIESDISEWRLELVGSVEEDFNRYIEEYYNKYPSLKERVLFTGNISDRKLLHEYFKRAGIFSLTSRIEGGTPNVISEALYTGCAIALTMFDAYPDAIGPLDDDDKICGMAAPVDDVEGYANILKKLCMSEILGEYQKNARWRAEKYFDSEKIERYLYGKLCNEGK